MLTKNKSNVRSSSGIQENAAEVAWKYRCDEILDSVPREPGAIRRGSLVELALRKVVKRSIARYQERAARRR